MASYKLAPQAETDLYRIWLYGVRQWGMEAADKYQRAFHERFEAIAASSLRYPAVDQIRKGYRRSVLRVKASIFASTARRSKSWRFWDSKIWMSGCRCSFDARRSGASPCQSDARALLLPS